MDKPVENFIAHYSDQYYDPAKAHAYYLRTRELKGKRSTADLKTPAQKEGFAFVKNQIGEAKKKDLTKLSDINKNQTKAIRATALKRRDEITRKLKTLIETLNNNQKRKVDNINAAKDNESKTIGDEVTKKILALPSIPFGISKQQRRALTTQRTKEIAKIRGEAITNQKSLSSKGVSDRKTLSEVSAKLKTKGRLSSTSDRVVVSKELKSSIEKARVNYKNAKDFLKVKYEQQLNQEFNAIKQKV